MPALAHALRDPLLEQLLGPSRLVAVHEHQGDREGYLEAPVLIGPAHAAAQGLLRVGEGGPARFAAQDGIPGPQSQDVALLQAAAGQLLGQPRQPPGAGG
ncbi:hypothetical protein [Streptomyces sp. NPDC058759]|uniref:hypothetical protein n=1 Tax=Streptomyces sp. NPDC058759 TaxID=3346628 RepID=UPI00369E22BE